MKRQFRVRINLDNAAFEEDQAAEVARILREFADHICDNEDRLVWTRLFDYNGNTVGKAYVLENK